MLRDVYNAVIAGERLIQMSKRVAVNETATHQLFAVNILVTIVNLCQQCNHLMKEEKANTTLKNAFLFKIEREVF